MSITEFPGTITEDRFPGTITNPTGITFTPSVGAAIFSWFAANGLNDQITMPVIPESESTRTCINCYGHVFKVPAGAAAYRGMETVENLVGPDNLIEAGSAIATHLGGGVYEMTGLSTSSANTIRFTNFNVNDIEGKYHVARFAIRAESEVQDGKTLIARLRRNSGGSFVGSDATVTLTTEDVEYSVGFLGGASNSDVQFQLFSDGTTTLGASDKVILSSLLVEDTTGNPDPTKPGPHVSVGVGQGENLWVDSPNSPPSNWIVNGDGSYSCDGTSNFLLIQQGFNNYELIKRASISLEIEDYVSGSVRIVVYGQGARDKGGTYFSGNGTHSEILELNSNFAADNRIGIQTNSFIGTIKNIVVKSTSHPSSGVDGLAYFDRKRDNISVNPTTHVVTETGEGTLIPWYQIALVQRGQTVEYSGESENLTALSGSAAVSIFSRQGALTVHQIDDNSSISSEFTTRVIPIASSTSSHYVVFEMLEPVGEITHTTLFRVRLQNGLSEVDVYAVVDLNDGVGQITVGAGEINLVYRAGGRQRWMVTVNDTGSGNDTIRVNMHPVWGPIGSAIADVSLLGSVFCASIEFYEDSWSYYPVLTTGGSPFISEADTGASTLPYVDAAHDAEGRVELYASSAWDINVLTKEGLITYETGVLKPLHFDTAGTNRITFDDGTYTNSEDNAFSEIDEAYFVKTRHGLNPATSTQRKQISLNAGPPSEYHYDTSFEPVGSPQLYKNGTRTMHFYAIAAYNEWDDAGWITEPGTVLLSGTLLTETTDMGQFVTE